MRTIIILVIVAVLAVGGWFGYQQYAAAQAEDDEPTYETVTVERGSIANTVSATGSIEPEAEVTLSFSGAGRVESVLVSAGERVAEGQLLATLDADDLALALAQANVTLDISRAQLAKLEKPVERNDVVSAQAAIEVAQAGVANAEAALTSAQASYNQLFVGATADQQTVNEANVRQAEASVKQAQQAYNQVRDQPNVGMLPQAAQLEQATVALEAARAQAALTDQGPTNAAVVGAQSQIAAAELGVRQAQSQLITAQDNLQTLVDGPAQEDVDIARAQVQQAELSVLQAERALQNAQITAPFDGVVSQVNIRQGELYAGGALLPPIQLTDLERFHMTVLVDEIDVRQLAEGQPARISVDALPERDLTGRIASISSTASDVNGVIAYEVEIVPDETDAPLRSGMSATAIITTAEVNDVLLISNRYIQLDRETDQAFVYRVVNGAPALQEIELGLRNESQSQIVAGVNEGDEIALVTRSSEEELRNAIFGG